MQYMSREQRMDILGRMGEKYVSNFLVGEGNLVEHAMGHFDSQKDLVCNGRLVEVKTQVPFIKEKAFTIRENQLRKCRGVDDLYFVAVPAPKFRYVNEGWLFHVDPKTFVSRKYITYDGRQMILIDIGQPAVTPMHQIEDSIVREMMKYTSSEY